MGYTQPSDLPVPFFLQNTLWDSLQKVILPEVSIKLYTEFTRASRQKQQHIINLHGRFDKVTDKGKIEPTKIVDAAWTFADIAMKYLDNLIVADADDVADLVADGFDVAYKSEGHEEGIALAVDNQLLGKTVPGMQEFLLPALHHELYGFFLKLIDGFTGTLEKMEKEDPAKLYKMTVTLLTKMTEHLEFVNAITKKHGKNHMYEVPALVMLKEFEEAGKLHPGTPGHYLQKEIATVQAELKQASGDKVEQLKQKLVELETQAAYWSNTHFYRQFTIDFLRMVGINSAKDLPIRASLQDKVWKLLIDKLGPKLFSLTSKKVGSSEIVNKSLASLVEILNKNIQESLIRSPAVEKYQEVVATKDKTEKARLLQEFDALVKEIAIKLQQEAETISKDIKQEVSSAADIKEQANPKVQAMLEKLLEQLGLALPGTWLETVTQWKRLRLLSGVQLEKVLLSSLKQWTLNSIAETAIVAGAKNVSKDALPVTPEEIKADKVAAEQRDQENQKKITDGLLKLVDAERESLEAWARGSIIGAIIHWILSPLLSLVFAILKNSVEKNAPKGRKNITDTPIHGNMVYYAVDNIRWLNNVPVKNALEGNGLNPLR